MYGILGEGGIPGKLKAKTRQDLFFPFSSFLLFRNSLQRLWGVCHCFGICGSPHGFFCLRQQTCLYARMRTFFLVRISCVTDVWRKGWTTQCVCAKVISSLYHVSVWCPCESFSSDWFFTHLFSVTTFSLVHTTDWHQKSSHALLLHGVECLALWPIRLQTHLLCRNSLQRLWGCHYLAFMYGLVEPEGLVLRPRVLQLRSSLLGVADA